MIRQPESFEEALSVLTLGIGAMERLTDLDEDQIRRLRQSVIRLSNVERKVSRG